MIYNVSGQLLFSSPVISIQTRLSLNGLAAGTYFYRITTENLSLQSGTFIKAGTGN
jgi:uncharacterized membrane protein affecting hemolysin expression